MVPTAYRYPDIPLCGSVADQVACRLVVDVKYAPSSVTIGVEGGVESSATPLERQSHPQARAVLRHYVEVMGRRVGSEIDHTVAFGGSWRSSRLQWNRYKMAWFRWRICTGISRCLGPVRSRSRRDLLSKIGVHGSHDRSSR